MASANSLRENKRQLLLTGSIPKVIPLMAIPTIVAMLVTSIYGLVDTYFVSSMGETAIDAIGINMGLDNLIMTLGAFLGMGANSFIARLLGAREDKKSSQVLSTSVFSAMIIGVVFAVLGLVFMEPFVRLLGATDNTVVYSMDYASYVLLAAPFMIASFVMSQCLRSEGSATFSMIGMLSGTVLNVGLAPIFIFGFGWGVKGAAIATAISKLLTFFVLLTPYLRRSSLLHLSVRNINYSREIVGEVSKMGSASLLRFGLSTIAMAVVNKIASTYSESVLAAMTVVNRLIFFPTAAILGFAQGFQPVAGINWGAGRYDRVKQAYNFTAWTGVIGVSIISLFLFVFAEPVMSIFGQTSAEMIAIGTLSIRLQCLAMPIQAWVIVVNMLYAGLGKGFGAIILGISRQGICFLPMLLILPAAFGAEGLAASQAAADVLTLVLTLPFVVVIMREIKQRLNTTAAMPAPAKVETFEG